MTARTDALSELIGQYVRTDDPAYFNCGAPKTPESEEHLRYHADGMCGPDNSFGGEGLVVEVSEDHDGTPFLVWDWGYAVPVRDTTKVTVLDQSAS